MVKVSTDVRFLIGTPTYGPADNRYQELDDIWPAADDRCKVYIFYIGYTTDSVAAVVPDLEPLTAWRGRMYASAHNTHVTLLPAPKRPFFITRNIVAPTYNRGLQRTSTIYNIIYSVLTIPETRLWDAAAYPDRLGVWQRIRFLKKNSSPKTLSTD